MKTRVYHLCAVVALILGTGMLVPWVAQAHASLNKCNIAPGAKLKTMPRTVSCTFAEGVKPKGSFIGIFETTGDHGEDDNENSQVSFSNVKQMTMTVPKLAKGTYALIWYTISADDGHHAAGYFTFSII
ncbi:MAG TPA: copper resistance protein CopC [Chloroflexota bacterium]|nr:copper resistance protein CopC [Chloroflexota bacterium]